MRRIAWMLAACALISPACAEPVDLEQLKLRPENFVGKTIVVQGILFGASRTRAFLHYKAGQLDDDMLTLEWADHGAVWERAQRECANEIEDKCTATVSGVLRSRPNQADTFYIEKAKVDFTSK